MIEPSATPDAWQVGLVAEGPGPLPEDRLRRFLKAALRSYGIRCLWFGPAHCLDCGQPIRKRRRARAPAKCRKEPTGAFGKEKAS